MRKTQNRSAAAPRSFRTTNPPALRRAIVETLDGRMLFCAPPIDGGFLGTTVPWMLAPMTVASGLNEAVDPAAAMTANPTPRDLTSTPAPIRINAGGGAYTDPSGISWVADRNFAGGTAATASFDVANTTSDPLYLARRYGAFNYNIPVAASGAYTLKLYFADPKYTSAGLRKFSVTAEGQTVLSNFDIAASGGGKAALVKSFAVNVTDGTLNLAFQKQLDNPIVSAIEVIPQNVSTSVGTVSGLTLVDANSDADIGPLASGATLDPAGGKAFSVRANFSGNVKSVKFLLDGQPLRIESSLPFAIAGDNGSTDYAPWSLPAAGNHTLSVVPYSGSGATGTAGSAYTVGFTVASGTGTGEFTTISYATKAPAPVGKAEALTASWGSRLYVFGGFAGNAGPVTRSDYYNTADNTWHTVARLPQPITHAGVAQDDQSVYIVAGYIGKGDGTGYQQTFGSNKVWVYHFSTDSYTSLPDLPKPLAGGGAALIDGKLHYFGGYNLDRTDTTIHLVLDLNNQAAGWQNAAPMLHGRSHLGVLVYQGKIWTIAGQIGNDEGLTTKNYVEVYDPATNLWSSKTPLPQSISHMASATFIMGDRFIVMGGESAHNVPIRNVWAYSPADNSWSALTPLPAAKFSGVADVFFGKIYFTTGSSQTTTWVGTVG